MPEILNRVKDVVSLVLNHSASTELVTVLHVQGVARDSIAQSLLYGKQYLPGIYEGLWYLEVIFPI